MADIFDQYQIGAETKTRRPQPAEAAVKTTDQPAPEFDLLTKIRASQRRQVEPVKAQPTTTETGGRSGTASGIANSHWSNST